MTHRSSLRPVPGFDIIASTTRSGTQIDEVEFAITNAPPVTAYLLGRRPEPQPIAIGLHDELGTKSTLLPDLEYLAARGFLCLSIDSPSTRSAVAERDHLGGFQSQFDAALTALNQLRGDPDTADQRIALIGRGIGGEVAANVAAHTRAPQVVVAFDSLANRHAFLSQADHPLAAGFRHFNDEPNRTEQLDGLLYRQLLTQLEVAAGTHWLLQVADDDDRLSARDLERLAQEIPRTVRVDHFRTGADIRSAAARRDRVEFISKLCG